MDLLARQRHVTRLLLVATADHGFVLAGSGAIREHAMIERPTEDVDLFTDSLDADGFAGDGAVLEMDLDVDAIRRTGVYTDEELLKLAESHDDGFDRRLFAERLRLAATLTPRRVEQYGIGEAELSGIQDRLEEWARALRG